MIGIFLSLSSFIAIFRGSVSPSRSTITGAFMDIWRARVPRTRARSYLVRNWVVILRDWRGRALDGKGARGFVGGSAHGRKEDLFMVTVILFVLTFP